jgi:hypothetical protein
MFHPYFSPSRLEMVEKYGPTLIAVQIAVGITSLTLCWALVATVLDVPAILAINGFRELANSSVGRF